MRMYLVQSAGLPLNFFRALEAVEGARGLGKSRGRDEFKGQHKAFTPQSQDGIEGILSQQTFGYENDKCL